VFRVGENQKLLISTGHYSKSFKEFVTNRFKDVDCICQEEYYKDEK
jgi:hypothetical protein